MANQKMAKEIRESVVAMVSEVVEYKDFEFMGFSSEGAIFNDGNDTFVVRVIVKADTFDFNDAIAEHDEKIAKAKEKEEAKKKKVDKAAKQREKEKEEAE